MQSPSCSASDALTLALKQRQWVRFTCKQSGSASVASLLPVPRRDGLLSLQLQQGRHLRFFRVGGRLDLNGGKEGPLTAFAVTAGPDNTLLLQSKVSGQWLSVNTGEFAVSTEPVPLLVEFTPPPPPEELVAPREVQHPMPPVDPSVLSAEDIAQFKKEGYLILRGAVPPNLIRDALRAINHQLGQPSCWEADSDGLNASQLRLKLTGQVCEAIFNQSPKFWSAVNILLGEGNVDPWGVTRNQAQVALRFPQPPEAGYDVPDVKPGTRYHIDGMGQNKPCPFSLLCGVALSEQTRPSMGNLHVFPGSHLHEGLRRYYSEMIEDEEQNEQDDRKPDLGSSTQVLLNPGDIVVAHQLLAHRVGVNTSEQIRYQLYYRVLHRNHAALKERIIPEPWTEFAIAQDGTEQASRPVEDVGGQEQRHVPTAPPTGSEGWPCPRCTYVNMTEHLVCAMCNSERPY